MPSACICDAPAARTADEGGLGGFKLAEADAEIAGSLTVLAAAAGVVAETTLPDLTELANHIAIWCANPASARPLGTCSQLLQQLEGYQHSVVRAFRQLRRRAEELRTNAVKTSQQQLRCVGVQCWKVQGPNGLQVVSDFL